VRKETITVQSERKTLVDRRKEASTGSPEVKANQQEDNEKFVTKNEFIPLDSQDTSDADLLEVGSDGHEEVCHICGKHGKLLWCDGCPISLHLDCIKVLGVRLPKSEDWYCPACLSLKAAREAAEAEKVSVLTCYATVSFLVICCTSGFSGEKQFHVNLMYMNRWGNVLVILCIRCSCSWC